MVIEVSRNRRGEQKEVDIFPCLILTLSAVFLLSLAEQPCELSQGLRLAATLRNFMPVLITSQKFQIGPCPAKGFVGF